MFELYPPRGASRLEGAPGLARRYYRPAVEPIDGEPVPSGTRRARTSAVVRGLAVDITPLRVSRDFRLLWTGELVSMVGRQITIVALPFQVFLLTKSSFAVGAIGLVAIVPLIVASIWAGPIIDRLDRRKLIVGTEIGLGMTSGLLALGAFMHTGSLAYLYLIAALQAALSGVNSPARSAAVPNLIPAEHLPSAFALNQVMFTTSIIAGPALGGVIIAKVGLPWAYSTDALTFLMSISAAFLLRPLPPQRAEGEGEPRGWRAIREGFAYVRPRPVLVSTFVIDLDAMIFGMPRAVFPVLALVILKVGPTGLGLMNAAPGVGALIGALTAGWVPAVRRQGLAVLVSVTVWGAAIVAFGLTMRTFYLGLSFLAVAGWADVISAVFRQTILQLAVPDRLRGRISGIHIMVVTGGPRLGDAEAGAVASLVSPWFSVVSGGALCVVGVAVIAMFLPQLGRYRAGQDL